MAEANLIVKIGGLLDSSLDRATRSAVSRIKNLGAELTSIGSSFSLGITAPIVAFGAAAVNAGKEIESLKLALQSIEGSAAGAERRFRELQEVAKLPGLGVREAVQADLALRAYGLTAERAKEATLAFGNALASAGRGKADLAETVRQFGQLSAAGKLTAENLKPIIERVPQVASILRQQFGVATAEALRDLGVTSQQAIDAIIAGLKELPPVTGGLKNSLENLGDAAEKTLAKWGETLKPFVDRFIEDFANPLLERVESLADSFKELPSSTQTAIVAIAAVAAASGPALLAFGALANSITNVITLYSKLPAAATLATTALSAGPWILLGGSILYAVLQIKEWVSVTKDAQNADRATAQLFFNTIDTLSNAGADMEAFRIKYAELIQQLKNARDLGLPISAASLGVLRAANVELVGLAKTWVPVADGAKKSAAGANALAQGLSSVGKEAQKVNAIRFEDRSLLNAVIAQESAGAVSKTVSRLVELRAELARLPIDAISIPQFAFSSEINLSTRSAKDLVAEISKIPGYTQLVEESWARVAGVIDRIPDSVRVFNRSQNQAAIEAGKQASKEFDKQQKEQERSAREAQRHIERYFHRTAQAIGDVLFSAKTAGQAITQFGREILKSIATAAIEAQLKRLTKMFIDFGTSLGATGIGKVLGGIFGVDLAKNAGGLVIKNATGAAASAAGSAASAAGSVGSAASAATSAAISSVTGIVTAVSSAVTAISSVVSNFQFAAMNKSLDLIEKEVRYSQIHLLHILENSNKYWPWIQYAHDRLRQLVDSGIGVYNAPGHTFNVGGAGGGGGQTINIDLRNSQFGGGTTQESVEQMFTTAARRLALAGGVG